jgi:hypothetical protein
MPTDWANEVKAAITHLQTKTHRVLEPDQALAIIDDVVEGKFAAGDLATIHDIPQESLRTTLGQITRASVAPPQVDEFFSVGEESLRANEFAELGWTEEAIWTP